VLIIASELDASYHNDLTVIRRTLQHFRCVLFIASQRTRCT